MAIAGRMADFLVKVSLLKSVLIWAAVQQHESVTCWYGACDGLSCMCILIRSFIPMLHDIGCLCGADFSNSTEIHNAEMHAVIHCVCS